MSDAEAVYILGFARTPFGRFFGALKDSPAHRLGALAVDEVMARTGVGADRIEAVYAGFGMAAGGVFTPARELVLASTLPDTTPSLAVDRACCSGMTAIGLAWQAIRAGQAGLVLAGGAENLSRTPGWAPRARKARPGDPAAFADAGPVYDPLLLRSPVAGKAIADYTGEEALAHGVSREEQDEWAAESHARYFAAEAAGAFAAERFAVHGLAADEGPRTDTSVARLAALPTLYNSPTITAGNAPGLADGAAFLLLGTRAMADKHGLAPLAEIVDHESVADGPTSGSWTPAMAIIRLLKRQGLVLTDLDLFEINEAYAATPLVSTLRLGARDLARARELRLRTNVHGGAVALGHPLGASGARITGHLALALRQRDGRRGVAAICGGYGQGEALLLGAPGPRP